MMQQHNHVWLSRRKGGIQFCALCHHWQFDPERLRDEDIIREIPAS